MKYKNNSAVWISWENQRRSIELAKALSIELFILDINTNKLFRYIISIILTINKLIKTKPRFLFVQNPSLVLVVLACLLKKYFGYKLIVDRHSNLKEETVKSKKIKHLIFHKLSFYTIKHASLTIVTNSDLKKFVDKYGGNGIVLTDAIPSFKNMKLINLKGKYNIVFISSYAIDEPYLEVIKSIRFLSNNIYIYITGSYDSIKNLPLYSLPKNIILTGFIDNNSFVNLLFSADAVIDLTTDERTLVCGGYEALALEKPFITSNKRVLVEYYNKGVLFTNNTPKDIADCVNNVILKKEKLRKEIQLLKQEKKLLWENDFQKLRLRIENL